IWVPFLGLAWWALDFPFMRRYSRQFLEKNPHLRGKDLERTQKACEKFKTIPVSIVNFVEGTRFTTIKHRRQNSPYKNLLNPRAGGVAFVLSAMGNCIHKIINVTIVYPDGADTFWGFISGRVRRVVVDIEVLPITDDLQGDYFNDPEFRDRFCNWINTLWKAKDEKIGKMLETYK
ncbi:MAG: acyltransferase, partial [Desulfamplus sp.]|nr:acyltransferase [Desulfamplus sp.]